MYHEVLFGDTPGQEILRSHDNSALLPPCLVWTIKFQLHKLVHVGIFHEYWTALHCIGYFTISKDIF